ncbi:MAG: UDP-N-acetylmuramate dehydrogenase [Alteromonadaceae bacterium]|nr:UDP-N-acetylmuramate dehydrogenase [Alteromonadaceae bacterium]
MINAQSLHTFGLQHCAQHCVSLSCQNDVSQLSQLSAPFYLLGQGSNTVFIDDYSGTLVLNKLQGISLKESEDAYWLSVASGENWHDLVTWCMDKDIGGFENLALIPGTVGAAPIQNIGAYGVEVGTLIHTVEYYDIHDGTFHTKQADECSFGYRDSIFKQSLYGRAFITCVNFRLPKDYSLATQYGELAALENPTMHDVYSRVIEIRRSKLPDPSVIGNAGSFFKNPVVSQDKANEILAQFPNVPRYPQADGQVKIAAGWLIEQCGFKGTTQGGVQCHPTQALVLTNYKDAKGQDVLTFARTISETVWTKFGIRLENEVRLLGRNGLVEL